jgi:hypothetical protein
MLTLSSLFLAPWYCTGRCREAGKRQSLQQAKRASFNSSEAKRKTATKLNLMAILCALLCPHHVFTLLLAHHHLAF